jgi:hypothetical protein
VAQPQRDHRSIDAGLQQLHGCGVPQDVRNDAFLLQRGTSLPGDGRVLVEQVLDAIRAQWP